MTYDETRATEWFDQFTTQPDFDRIDADSHWWCARHWAPCPMMGAKGIGMTIELASIFLNEFANGETDTVKLDAMLGDPEEPLCCRLGDKRMYALWGGWGPEK